MEPYISITKKWIQTFVVDLKLCPFAVKPFNEERIHYRVSLAKSIDQLLEDLVMELRQLVQTPPENLETTLLIHPFMGPSFTGYLDILEIANQTVEVCQLEGVIQVAGFHPDYQFEGTKPEEASNYTNRSPYPMLHLLREDSVTKAVETYPDVEQIPNNNIITMLALGEEVRERWKDLFE